MIEAIYLLPEIEAGIIKPYPRLLGYEHCYLVHQFIIIILFWVTIWSVKGSFLAFYRTIFSGHFIGWQTSAWWGVVALSALTWTANFILQFFACVPFESYFILGRRHEAFSSLRLSTNLAQAHATMRATSTSPMTVSTSPRLQTFSPIS